MVCQFLSLTSIALISSGLYSSARVLTARIWFTPREIERERECLTSEYSFNNCDSWNDKEFRGDDQRQTHLRKNIGSFKIIGCTESEGRGLSNGLWFGGVPQPMVKGIGKFKRILIR